MSQYSQVLIDTNAFEYLDKLGIRELCFQIIAEPLTSDLIRSKEISEQKWESMARCGLKAIGLSEEQMFEVMSSPRGRAGPSPYDLSLVVLAKAYDYAIFTEDVPLIKFMEKEGVNHVSLPAMIHSMVEEKMISHDEAVDVLRRAGRGCLPGWHHKHPEIYRQYFPRGGLQ